MPYSIMPAERLAAETMPRWLCRSAHGEGVATTISSPDCGVGNLRPELSWKLSGVASGFASGWGPSPTPLVWLWSAGSAYPRVPGWWWGWSLTTPLSASMVVVNDQ